MVRWIFLAVATTATMVVAAPAPTVHANSKPSVVTRTSPSEEESQLPTTDSLPAGASVRFHFRAPPQTLSCGPSGVVSASFLQSGSGVSSTATQKYWTLPGVHRRELRRVQLFRVRTGEKYEILRSDTEKPAIDFAKLTAKQPGARPLNQVVSANGRFSVWAVDWPSGKNDDEAFVMIDTEKGTAGPLVNEWENPSWVSPLGGLVFAKATAGRQKNQWALVSGQDGSVVFPKPGGPLLSPSRPSMSFDGKRILLEEIEKGGGKTWRLYALPNWKLLQSYPSLGSLALSPDGTTVFGTEPDDSWTTRPVFYQATSGERLPSPPWARQGRLLPCDDRGGRYAFVSDKEERKDSYPVLVFSDLGQVLGAPRLSFSRKDIGKLVGTVQNGDAFEAWKAIQTLRFGDVRQRDVARLRGKAREESAIAELRFRALDP